MFSLKRMNVVIGKKIKYKFKLFFYEEKKNQKDKNEDHVEAPKYVSPFASPRSSPSNSSS